MFKTREGRVRSGQLFTNNLLYQITKITLSKREHREIWKGLFSMSMGQRAQGAELIAYDRKLNRLYMDCPSEIQEMFVHCYHVLICSGKIHSEMQS